MSARKIAVSGVRLMIVAIVTPKIWLPVVAQVFSKGFDWWVCTYCMPNEAWLFVALRGISSAVFLPKSYKCFARVPHVELYANIFCVNVQRSPCKNSLI